MQPCCQVLSAILSGLTMRGEKAVFGKVGRAYFPL